MGMAMLLLIWYICNGPVMTIVLVMMAMLMLICLW